MIRTSCRVFCRFMPPDDPLGRSGPTLDTFLRVPASPAVGAAPGSAQPCPYGKKCTYGNKCKFFHAERGNVPIKTVTDKLKVEREYTYYYIEKTHLEVLLLEGRSEK